MSIELDISGRDARDRLAQSLGLGVPHPLRDLPLRYDGLVAWGVAPEIRVCGAQRGVTYRLCDEDGNPVPDRAWVAGTSLADALLQAPAVTQDLTYTVLARREQGGERIETYLSERVWLRAGINTKLAVEVDCPRAKVVGEHHLVVPFGESLSVVILDSQDGVDYWLVEDGIQDAPRSESQAGNRARLRLTTTAGLAEDLTLRIQARRQPKPPVLLEVAIRVDVRPNPAVACLPKTSVLDYGVAAEFQLSAPQPTVSYRLYRRLLVPTDYLDAGSPGALGVPLGDGRTVSLRPPERADAVLPPPGFEDAGELPASGSMTTGSLHEDTVFVTVATKKDNGEGLLLAAAAAVLVRPDPRPQVVADPASIERGAEGLVWVSSTQRGIAYQLCVRGTPVGLPGCHFEDRRVGSTRVGVDFVVEDVGDPRVLLPTGPLRDTTAFKVVATKLASGLTADLVGKVSVRVSGGSGTQPPAVGSPPPVQPPPAVAADLDPGTAPAKGKPRRAATARQSLEGARTVSVVKRTTKGGRPAGARTGPRGKPKPSAKPRAATPRRVRSPVKSVRRPTRR